MQSLPRRGLNCTAIEYNSGTNGAMYKLGENFADAWINPKTGKTLTPTILKGKSDSEIIAKLKKQILQPGEYVLGYNSKKGKGHVVNIINNNGNIIIHDEQAIRQSGRYLALDSFNDIDYLEIIRIDKMLLNIDLVKNVLVVT